jgi:hypothetical protein
MIVSRRRRASAALLALLAAAPCQAAPTWDFTGNSFSGGTGGTYNQVSEAAQDMAVSPDGMVVHGASWVESAHDVRVITQSGDSVGPRPGSSAGRFRESGGGPKAVAITDTTVYAAQARRVVKWDRSAFVGTTCGTCTMNGTTFNVSGTGTLVGLAVGGGRIFVADAGASVGETVPDTATVKALSDSTGAVLNTWTVPRVRHLDVDRQGNVWALQQRTSTQAPRLSRWSPTGTAMESFALTGDPTDVAANPNADEVWITDNGPDQRVEKYSYAGTQVGTFGESYLNGPTPGLIGPLRFAGPRGLDLATNGDVYVMTSLAGNRGTHVWDDTGDGAMFERYQADGTRVWMRYGTMGQPGEPSNDGTRFYANNITYQNVGGHYVPYAVNIDPFTGGDPRFPNAALDFSSGTTRTDYREFDGQKWIAKHGPNNDYLRVFRFNGEIAQFVRQFSASEGESIADNGDVWQAGGNTVTRYPYTGNSTWGAAVTYPAPPAIDDLRRIEVHGNSVYLSGFDADVPFVAGFDDWKNSGRRIARYDALPTGSGWPAPRWTVDVPWQISSTGWTGLNPTSLSTDTNTVAVGYLQGGDSRGQGYVRLYDASTGAFLQTLVPPADYGELYGWLDMKESVAFKNGILSMEANGQNKDMLWGEFSGQPPPPPPPDTTPPTQPGNPTKTSSTQTSVSMSWAPSTDNVGVTSYVVYRNGSGIAFTPGSQTNYTDTGLACGTTYTYGVRAGDAAGNVSTMATASLSTDACTPPPNPQCSDGVDNDLDGKIAYPADPGCSSATDDSESPDPPPPPPPPGSETLSDVADAYTDASKTTTNYGTQTVL